MGIAIFLRTQEKPNNFRRSVLSVIEDKEINYILMTYPYFYERKPYYEYKCNNNVGVKIKKEGKYSILDDELSKSILNRNSLVIDTIASKSDALWRESYGKFINKLKAGIKANNKNVKYKAYLGDSQNSKLHAKIMIGCKKDGSDYNPVILMIGSSNLTNSAFGEMKYFNYESDIILWNDRDYNFNVEKLEVGDLKPILCKSKDDGIEKEYIDYFWRIFIEDFKKHLEEVNE